MLAPLVLLRKRTPDTPNWFPPASVATSVQFPDGSINPWLGGGLLPPVPPVPPPHPAKTRMLKSTTRYFDLKTSRFAIWNLRLDTPPTQKILPTSIQRNCALGLAVVQFAVAAHSERRPAVRDRRYNSQTPPLPRFAESWGGSTFFVLPLPMFAGDKMSRRSGITPAIHGDLVKKLDPAHLWC